MSAPSKFKKQKNFRRRKQSSSSEDDETEAVRAKIEETKEAQKFRERQKGVSAVTLALGKKLSKEDEIVNNDPFKLKTGGLINMKDIKDRNRDRTDEGLNRDVSNMGSTFAAETNQRDEEAEMMKYIEERMMEANKAEEEEKKAEKYKSPEDKLYELPENLKIGSVQKSEEMLSNQMLSGIPEVDLGTEAKIRNIERTEEAKQKHITESRQKKKNTTSFVPTNMATCMKNLILQEEKLLKKKHLNQDLLSLGMQKIQIDQMQISQHLPRESLKVRRQQMTTIMRDSESNSEDTDAYPSSVL